MKKCGYSVVTLWLLCGYSVVTLWLLCGYSVVTLWLLCYVELQNTFSTEIQLPHCIHIIKYTYVTLHGMDLLIGYSVFTMLL